MDIDHSQEFAAYQPLGDAAVHVGRIMELLERIHLFEGFEPQEIERLASFMRCYAAEAGVEIIHEGDAGDFMLLLLEGSVEIVRVDSRGLPQQVGTAGPGKTLGEMSLIDGEPRFASCITLEPTEFAVLDRSSLIRIIADEPRIGVKILMELLMLLNQRLRALSGEYMKCLENQRLRIR